MQTMNTWDIAIMAYLILALLGFIPVLQAMLRRVKLNPGGESFTSSLHFSEFNKIKLEQHFSRIQGTLIFWKNQAAWYKRFHYYTMIWTIPISILIPIISQSISTDSHSRLFLTIISSHTAILIGFHRALKVENNFKAFRNGESEFYDVYRRMLDRPGSSGESEEKQIETYFMEVERTRKSVRSAETDNLPMLEDTRPKQSS